MKQKPSSRIMEIYAESIKNEDDLKLMMDPKVLVRIWMYCDSIIQYLDEQDEHKPVEGK